jgi:hypothetical protein
MQHHAQDTVDAEPGVPEAHAVHLFNQVHGVGRQMRTQIIASVRFVASFDQAKSVLPLASNFVAAS